MSFVKVLSLWGMLSQCLGDKQGTIGWLVHHQNFEIPIIGF